MYVKLRIVVALSQYNYMIVYLLSCTKIRGIKPVSFDFKKIVITLKPHIIHKISTKYKNIKEIGLGDMKWSSRSRV